MLTARSLYKRTDFALGLFMPPVPVTWLSWMECSCLSRGSKPKEEVHDVGCCVYKVHMLFYNAGNWSLHLCHSDRASVSLLSARVSAEHNTTCKERV
jgi:hypothetical protein